MNSESVHIKHMRTAVKLLSHTPKKHPIIQLGRDAVSSQKGEEVSHFY